MANKRSIKKHKETVGVTGFMRYLLAQKVIESSSFNDLFVKLSSSSLLHGYEARLYKELKFYNTVLLVEQGISPLLQGLYLQKKLTLTFNSVLCEKLCRYRAEKKKKAQSILNFQTKNKQVRLLSPHILFYVCGMGLGNLVGLLRDSTSLFRGKTTLISRLDKFNQYRTDVVHSMLSSRIDSDKQLDRGIKSGIDINNLISRLPAYKKCRENFKS